MERQTRDSLKSEKRQMERQTRGRWKDRQYIDGKPENRQMGRQTRDKEGNRLETDGKAGKREMRRQTRCRWKDSRDTDGKTYTVQYILDNTKLTVLTKDAKI